MLQEFFLTLVSWLSYKKGIFTTKSQINKLRQGKTILEVEESKFTMFRNPKPFPFQRFGIQQSPYNPVITFTLAYNSQIFHKEITLRSGHTFETKLFQVSITCKIQTELSVLKNISIITWHLLAHEKSLKWSDWKYHLYWWGRGLCTRLELGAEDLQVALAGVGWAN